MFFGWYVVGGGFLAQMLVVGFFTYAVSLLVVPVRAEFGVSLEQVMYSLTVGTFAGMVVAPLAGALIDRYPMRWLMSGGVVIFAVGLLLLANSTSITQYVVIFGLTMALTNGFAGSMATSTAISRWFTSSRGKALGIAAIGTSAGGILIPALVTYWLAETGWRGTMENLAMMALIVILPLVFLSVRGRPEEVGLLPEGASAENPPATSGDRQLGFQDIIRNPAYWYIGLSLGALFCVYSAVLANLTPYATGLGYSAAQGSTLIMALAIASFAGKLMFGFIADKIDLKHGLWGAQLLVAVALLILASEPGYFLILVSACLMGLATGGMLPVWGSMMARVFGLLSYGKAMGLMGPLITLSVMPGFTLIGRLYDANGNYQLALLVFSGITMLAAALLVPLRLAPTQG
ncbi:MAG: MFS transporter [Gammaproteobacteria bacterium]|nr:MFS transporter [Gammaproteobacteria bacterium]